MVVAMMLPGTDIDAGPRCKIVCADAVEFLQGLAPRSVGCIVTDPAYEALEKHRAHGTTTRLTTAWFDIFPNERFPRLFEAAWTALAENAHFYVFCDHSTMFAIEGMRDRLPPFRFWKPIIWDKRTIGMGYHYRARYEVAMFFEKGSRRLNDLSVPDVLCFKALRGPGVYPTQKPVELLECLITNSTVEGELVADPFLGSGTTAVAALKTRRRFAGCDIEPAAVDLANARVRDET